MLFNETFFRSVRSYLVVLVIMLHNYISLDIRVKVGAGRIKDILDLPDSMISYVRV